MSQLVADCPRCTAKRTTFDVLSDIEVDTRYGWQYVYEAFSICRHCHRSTVFILIDEGPEERRVITSKGGLSKLNGSLNGFVRISSFVSQKDAMAVEPPQYLPEAIQDAFTEGARCRAIGCHNASATMFRLCVDLATRRLLPTGEVEGLTSKKRRDLGLRLPWLFENGKLPEGLQGLSSCIKEDGNDGAHAGTLTAEEADDLLDFTTLILERMYTEPKRLELAQTRREERRAKPK